MSAERHNGLHASLLGDCFTAAGCLSFAYFVIRSKRVRTHFDPLSINTMMFASSAVLMLPISVGGIATGGMAHVTWHGWLALLYMAALSSVTAYMIFYYALKYIPATRVSAFSYLQPPVASALGWLLLGERVTLPLLAGATVIFTGVYLTEKG